MNHSLGDSLMVKSVDLKQKDTVKQLFTIELANDILPFLWRSGPPEETAQYAVHLPP